MQEAYALADRQQYARLAYDFTKMYENAVLTDKPVEEVAEIIGILFRLIGLD